MNTSPRRSGTSGIDENGSALSSAPSSVIGRSASSDELLELSVISPVSRITVLCVRGSLLARRGELGAMDLLSGKKLQGAFMGANRFPVDIPRLVDFYLRGLLDLDTIVSDTITLEQVNEGFERMKSGVAARSVIGFGCRCPGAGPGPVRRVAGSRPSRGRRGLIAT